MVRCQRARAALETFNYAFNIQSLDLVRQIWADNPLVKFVSPIGDTLRGSASIAVAYARMLPRPVRIQSAFEDIVAYVTPELVVFTWRERGTFTPDHTHDTEQETMPARPDIRTTCVCIFRFIAHQGGWRQVYHAVLLDDADQFAQFQRAMHGA